jgi:hypothetical protein
VSLWFFLWLLLSVALVGFLAWTAYILFRQKRAWKAYAKKYKLRYTPGRLFDSPEMAGPMGDYTVSLFTGEHIAGDARTTRKLTAVEIQLFSNMPFEGAVASNGMVEFTKDLGLGEEVRPDHKGWDKSYIATSDNKAALAEYLNKDRLTSLTDLMKTPNAWVIFVFRGDMTLLRFDTPEPLDMPQDIDKIVKRMLEAAKVMELDEGEGRRLKAAVVKKPKKEKSLDVKDGDLNTGLSLEEEDEQSADSEGAKDDGAKDDGAKD